MTRQAKFAVAIAAYKVAARAAYERPYKSEQYGVTMARRDLYLLLREAYKGVEAREVSQAEFDALDDEYERTVHPSLTKKV